jgi:putative hydrolase of the HAD superfamily
VSGRGGRTARQVDAVLFDFGGVLVREGSIRELARIAPDHDPDDVLAIALGEYHSDGDHPWHRVERGELAMAEWYRLTVMALEQAGMAVAARPSGDRPPVVFTPSEPMVDAVREARAAGCRTAVVTNNARELGTVWRAALPLDELFDTVVDSSAVGVRKPGAAIFALTLERLGVAADRAAFLDDVASNCEGARRTGLHAILVEPDPAPAIAELRTLLGGP